MNFKTKITACTCLAIVSINANASTIIQSQSFDFTASVGVTVGSTSNTASNELVLNYTPFDTNLGSLVSIEFSLTSILRNVLWSPGGYGEHGIAVSTWQSPGNGEAQSTAAGTSSLSITDTVTGDLFATQFGENVECSVNGGFRFCDNRTLSGTAYNDNTIETGLAGYQNAYDVTLSQIVDLSVLALGVNGLAEGGLRSPWSGTLEVTYNYSIVPIPGAAWLFGSGLLGLIGVARRKTSA